jgi:hypothetical protein
MTPFLYLTGVDGLPVRLNVAAVTSYKDSGALLPGGTTISFEEGETATMISVMQSVSDVDKLIEEKFSQ